MTGWMDRAACQDVDPELFFPVGSGELADKQAAAARAVCDRCRVRLECLAWAQRIQPADGVWGGLTVDERQAARPAVADRPRRRAADRPLTAALALDPAAPPY